MLNNEEIIMEMVGGIDYLEAALSRFEVAQDEDSDEGNEDKIQQAHSHIEDLRGVIEDLVP